VQDVWDAVDAVSKPLEAKTAKNQPYLPLAGMTIAKMLGVTKAMRARYELKAIPAIDESPQEIAERTKRTDRDRKRAERADKGAISGPVIVEMEKVFQDAVAPIVLALRAEGKSQRAIARELNERGITTPSGVGEWDHSMVRRVLAKAEKQGGATASESNKG